MLKVKLLRPPETGKSIINNSSLKMRNISWLIRWNIRRARVTKKNQKFRNYWKSEWVYLPRCHVGRRGDARCSEIRLWFQFQFQSLPYMRIVLSAVIQLSFKLSFSVSVACLQFSSVYETLLNSVYNNLESAFVSLVNF